MAGSDRPAAAGRFLSEDGSASIDGQTGTGHEWVVDKELDGYRDTLGAVGVLDQCRFDHLPTF